MPIWAIQWLAISRGPFSVCIGKSTIGIFTKVNVFLFKKACFRYIFPTRKLIVKKSTPTISAVQFHPSISWLFWTKKIWRMRRSISSRQQSLPFLGLHPRITSNILISPSSITSKSHQLLSYSFSIIVSADHLYGVSVKDYGGEQGTGGGGRAK